MASWYTINGRVVKRGSGYLAKPAGGGGASTITPSLIASRTSATAPAFVHFDATGTTSSDSAINSSANGAEFRNVTHAFDFADSGSGTWSTTGNSRNTHTGGPITGHYFNSPGTYIVKDVCSASGTTDATATVTVTLADPATTYSGTNTIVVGTLSALPGLSSASYVMTQTTLTNNRRYLFLRGGSFSVNGGDWSGIRIDAVDSSGVIGSGGSGAKPIITGTWQIGVSTNASDNCVANITFNGFFQFVHGDHNAAWNVTVQTPTNSQIVATNEDGFGYLKYTLFGEMTIDGTGATGSNGQYSMYLGYFSYGCIMGCTTVVQQFHDVRIPHSYKSAIQNNRIVGNQTNSGMHSLKLNGGGYTASPPLWDGSAVNGTSYATEKLVVSNNILGNASSPEDWTIECAPQNDVASPGIEGIQDVVIENNQFYRGSSGSAVDIQQGGRRITRRGNTSINSSMVYGTSCNSSNIPSGWDGPYFTS